MPLMVRGLQAAILVVALAVLAARPGYTQADVSTDAAARVADLAVRRNRVMAAIGPDTVLVLWSAPTRNYSRDIDYEYRQDSDLLYLSGVTEEQTVLVLVPGSTTRKAFLFARQADPFRELWYGHIPTPAELTARSGISAVFPQRGAEAFDAFISGLLGGETSGTTLPEFDAIRAAQQRGEAKLAIAYPLDINDADAAPHLAWAREQQRRYTGVTVVSASDLLMAERQIKTPYEQAVLRKSLAISSDAHVEGMRATRPGRWEYEIEAVIEAWFKSHGATSWGYPSIVASGPNALTLHYLDSTRQMLRGDLLLVDAAGSYEGLTGDITRTYPVGGKFSAEQRTIYDLVLRAQDAGIAAARPGRPVDDVTKAVRATFADGLLALGLISSDGPQPDAQVGLWFPHGPVHGIGLDVHEPVSMLDVGTAFVIEPGLYIRSDALDRLPATPENAALVARLAPAVARYRNIGVRIEDSFLMTPTGPVMLSARVPRRALDIEKLVGRGR